MWYSSIDGDEAVSAGPERSTLGLPNDPGLEAVNIVAGGLMEVLGPLFWAVLIIGFLFPEFWLKKIVSEKREDLLPPSPAPSTIRTLSNFLEREQDTDNIDSAFRRLRTVVCS